MLHPHGSTYHLERKANYSWAPAGGRGGAGGIVPPWIFVHDTDKVEGGLMVLFFSRFYSVNPPSPPEIFLPTPLKLLLMIILLAYFICNGTSIVGLYVSPTKAMNTKSIVSM